MTLSTLPCKCCGADALIFDHCDFNKSCEEARGLFLKPSGTKVAYHRCQRCGFIFTADFDKWDIEKFQKHIYNEGYINVDPDYVAIRPKANATTLMQMFGKQVSRLRLLDYGGGNGYMAKLLQQSGFKEACAYDPFYDGHNQKPQRPFDIVTAFEVMEHVPDPVTSLKEMLSLLKPGGLLYFSTLLQPPEIELLGGKWWYIAPRNGHIAIHSEKSLSMLLGRFGYKLASANSNLHFAYKKIPTFAKHLFKGGNRAVA